SQKLTIGGQAGSYDEVAVYPAALSPTQVRRHWTAGAALTACASVPTSGYGGAVAADSPNGYWRLGGVHASSAGRVACDSSGHCDNGSYADAAVAVAKGTVSPDDGAVSVATGAVAANIPAVGLPAGASARTVEFWVDGVTTGECCRDAFRMVG